MGKLGEAVKLGGGGLKKLGVALRELAEALRDLGGGMGATGEVGEL